LRIKLWIIIFYEYSLLYFCFIFSIARTYHFKTVDNNILFLAYITLSIWSLIQ